MEHQRFDDLVRNLAIRDTGRRSALRLVAGSALALFGVLSAEEAEAHNARAKCRKIEDKKKRAKCLKQAKKHNAKHKDKGSKLDCNPPCPERQGCARVTCVEGECVVRSEPVAAGQTCRPDAGQCDIAETCDGESLDCPPNQFRPSTVECRSAQCLTESSARLVTHCTGSAATCPESTVQDCGQYQCHNTACRTSCNNDSHCLSSAWCNPNHGFCSAKQDNGTTCSAASPTQCKSGHCVDGTCCDRQCPAPPNSTTTCPGGTCSFVCHEGWADCNGTQNDGCEMHIHSDPDNCGGCNQVCRGTCGNFGQGTLECIDGSCDCIINAT